MAHLRVKSPDGPQSVDRIVPLDRDVITLGREPGNALVLASTSVSRHHARIEREAGGWAVVDQGSSYGTYVQGQKVVRQRLVHGDVLALGDMRIEYFEDGYPVAAPPPLIPEGIPPPFAAPLPQAVPPLLAIPISQPIPPPFETPVPQHWPPPSTPQVWGPPAIPPPLPQRRSLGLILGLGGGAVALLLLLGLGAWLAWPRLKGDVAAGTPTAQKPEPPPPDPEAAVAEVLEGFRQGDAKRVAEASHPASREAFRRVFENQPDRMQRAAAVLSSRKRVHVEGGYAEYEVTDNGRTYPVQFEYTAGKWLLVSM